MSLIIYEDGSVQDVELLRDIGGGCGEEAVRVAKSMPNWSPGLQRGKPVKTAYKIPVKFRLGEDNKGTKKKKWFNRR